MLTRVGWPEKMRHGFFVAELSWIILLKVLNQRVRGEPTVCQQIILDCMSIHAFYAKIIPYLYLFAFRFGKEDYIFQVCRVGRIYRQDN